MEFNREQLDMALSEIEEEVIFNPFHNPAADAYAEHVLGLEKETVIGFKPKEYMFMPHCNCVLIVPQKDKLTHRITKVIHGIWLLTKYYIQEVITTIRKG